MTSSIDTTKPDASAPTTASVRANFTYAKSEIEALQAKVPASASANQVLGMNAANTAPEAKTVTAGAGISVTHSAGQITIAQQALGADTLSFYLGVI